MKYAIKQQGKQVFAYELGAGSQLERELIHQGKIHREGERYALFSREAVNGQGQQALAGDFFKLDGDGFPYPNDREWFFANHRPVGGDVYEQLPKPLEIWEAQDGEHPLVQWLVAEGRLRLRPEEPERFFNARLWGADLSAAWDAVLVFYGVERNEAGEIVDISFNFVAREEFRKTYFYCDARGNRM